MSGGISPPVEFPIELECNLRAPTEGKEGGHEDDDNAVPAAPSTVDFVDKDVMED